MIDGSFLLFVFHVAMATTMRELTDSFAAFSRIAAPVVAASLWQGAMLALALAICLHFARRASAAHRFAIWAAGFGALVCLPFLPLLMSAWAGGASSVAQSQGAAGPLLRLDPRWSFVLGAFWIAASAFRVVSLAIHSHRLRQLWKSATPVEDSVQTDLGQAGRLLAGALPRAAQICTTQQLDRPAVIGFFAPRILIPEWLFARLTRDELEHVVLHESQHLHRYDDWANLVQKLCLVVFPLNPALVWMERQLCAEREMACDDGVVRATQAPRAYAACLASLAERGLKHRTEALTLGAWQRRPELVHRVHRILRRTPGLSPLATRALIGALSCGLVFGSIEFARCPQLVAFVPALRLAAQHQTSQGQASEAGDARFVDASYRLDKSASGFRAIDAVAHMPVATAARTTGKRLAASPQSFTTTSRRVQLKAEALGSQTVQREERVQPQWVVFTAWERVESSGSIQSRQAAGVRQDYDSAATEDETAGESKDQPNDGVSRHEPVTQLILRVYPAAVFTPPASDSPEAISPNSASSNSTSLTSTTSADQPAAIQLRDGWFFFQL